MALFAVFESVKIKESMLGLQLMGAGLDGVKKERQAISARINQLSEKVKAAKDEIQVLENELKTVTEKRDKAYSNIRELRKQRDENVQNTHTLEHVCGILKTLLCTFC